MQLMSVCLCGKSTLWRLSPNTIYGSAPSEWNAISSSDLRLDCALPALPFPIYNEKTLVSVSSEESFRDHESIETAEVQELVGPPYHIVGKVPHDCGPHGDILTAVRTDDHGNVVVLKKLRVPHMDEDSARTSWALIELIFRLSQGFAHSNIGSILGLDKSGTLGTLPVLTLPLYVLGNVMQYTKDNISASKLALMTQACCGLAYLHSVILHHGNVTPPNILINDKGQAVLCDWGIGLALHPLWSPYNHVSTSWPRTAPEVIADFNSSSAADVFSFSLSVYEVFMGCLPHAKKPYGRGVVNMMKYGITLDKPMAINSAIWSVLEQGWAFNPLSRPSASKMHQLLRNIAST